MSRYAKRRDNCEASIVAALRAMGASVQTLDESGCVDLLVGVRGRTYLIECTDGGRQREAKERWARNWNGEPTLLASSPLDALRIIGVCETCCENSNEPMLLTISLCARETDEARARRDGKAHRHVASALG